MSAEDEDEEEEAGHLDPQQDSAEAELTTMQKKIVKLKEKLHQVQKQNQGLRKSMSCQEKKLSKLFAPDQRKALRRRGTKGLLWSAHTVKKALQLRLACGASGYDLLLKNHQPLPSIRTLQRRMKTISFKLGQVFQFLKLKVQEMKSEERLCCLTLDEMSITSNVEYMEAAASYWEKLHYHVTQALQHMVLSSC